MLEKMNEKEKCVKSDEKHTEFCDENVQTMELEYDKDFYNKFGFKVKKVVEGTDVFYEYYVINAWIPNGYGDFVISEHYDENIDTTINYEKAKEVAHKIAKEDENCNVTVELYTCMIREDNTYENLEFETKYEIERINYEDDLFYQIKERIIEYK